MARLTTEELQEAKRRKAEERAAEQERLAKKQQAEAAEREREAQERAAHMDYLTKTKERHAQLASVVDALSTEADKFSLKYPTMPVSKLTLERTNKAILAVKGLLKDEGDDFVDDIAEFIPAGDDPEYRDVALTLRELKAALGRFQWKYRNEWRDY